MKIKIIDLFNKIANDEEVPKKIKYFGEIYEYSEDMKFYYQNDFSMYRDFFTEGNCLNEEVEILEEDKPIIEKIKINKYKFHNTNHSKLLKNQETLENKLNEVINYINRKDNNNV